MGIIMEKEFNSKLFKFISGWEYVVLFSVIYAIVIGAIFYPGLLYSDSVTRWNTAILVANSGLDALAGVSDHHPILPILLMAFFYKITGEIGFFSIVQVLFFSGSFFLLVRHFSPTFRGNFFASIALLLPVSQVYSIFISYDSLFSIFLIFLILSLLSKGRQKLILVPIIVATIIGTRMNSVVILPFVILVLLSQTKNFRRIERMSSVLACIFLSAVIWHLPVTLDMKKGNSWLIGTAWEYANMATKTNDDRDINFLKSVGTSPAEIESGICYHGIWCGKEYVSFISKIDNKTEKELVKNYMLILVNHPVIFITEKLKYIKSLMGIGFNLYNAEIGRWHEKIWQDHMEPLGFKSSTGKENFIKKYFVFSDYAGVVLFKPWIVFCIFFLVSYYLRRLDPNSLTVILIPTAYYGTFFITSQNHELRYFFPVVFIFLAYVSAFCAVFLRSFSQFIFNRYELFINNK